MLLHRENICVTVWLHVVCNNPHACLIAERIMHIFVIPVALFRHRCTGPMTKELVIILARDSLTLTRFISEFQYYVLRSVLVASFLLAVERLIDIANKLNKISLL